MAGYGEDDSDLPGFPTSPRTGATPPYYPGATPPIMPEPSAPEQPTRKPGMFGRGGIGRTIIGSIGDALVQESGGQPVYAPAVQQRREMDFNLQKVREAQQAQLDRQIQLAQWKLQNPEPATPPPEQRAYEWFKGLPPEEKAQAIETLDQLRPKVIGNPLDGYRYEPRPRGGVKGPADDAPIVEDGFQYTPGPGGRANQSNWKPVASASGMEGGRQPAFTPEMYRGLVASLGQAEADAYLQGHGLMVGGR